MLKATEQMQKVKINKKDCQEFQILINKFNLINFKN